MLLSSATGAGVQSLVSVWPPWCRRCGRRRWSRPPAPSSSTARCPRGCEVQRVTPGVWRVLGRVAERAVAFSDLNDDGALDEAVKRLRRLGVDRALTRAGVRDGDEVTVGTMTFTWGEPVSQGTGSARQLRRRCEDRRGQARVVLGDGRDHRPVGRRDRGGAVAAGTRWWWSPRGPSRRAGRRSDGGRSARTTRPCSRPSPPSASTGSCGPGRTASIPHGILAGQVLLAPLDFVPPHPVPPRPRHPEPPRRARRGARGQRERRRGRRGDPLRGQRPAGRAGGPPGPAPICSCC